MTPLNVGISETIRDHLTKQKAQAGYQPPPLKARDGSDIHANFQCQYRDDQGRMCAVGVLLTDAVYSPVYEGSAVVFNDKIFYALERLYPGVDRSLLASWQGYHDGGQYKAWCEGGGNMSPQAFHNRLLGKL